MSVDLSAVHVLHGILGIVRIGVFNVSEAFAVGRMQAIDWEIDVLYDAVGDEDLVDMIFGDVPGETTDVNSNRFRCRRPFLATLRV